MSTDSASVWPAVVVPGSPEAAALVARSRAGERQVVQPAAPAVRSSTSAGRRVGRTVATAQGEGGSAEELHRGHLRMAERFLVLHRDGLRHVHGVGWHVWDGARWARDLNGAATRAAVETVKAAYLDLPHLDSDGRKALLADINRCESSAGLDGLVRIAGDLLPLAVTVSELDANPYPGSTALP